MFIIDKILNKTLEEAKNKQIENIVRMIDKMDNHVTLIDECEYEIYLGDEVKKGKK